MALDLFDDPSGIMKEYIFSQFHLADVGQIPDEVLKEQPWLNVSQFCLKHAFARDLLKCLPEIIALWQELVRMGGIHHEDYIVESSGKGVKEVSLFTEPPLKIVQAIENELKETQH
jgi:hypothetical protein